MTVGRQTQCLSFLNATVKEDFENLAADYQKLLLETDVTVRVEGHC